jgi:TorA maturation chaperone TorD
MINSIDSELENWVKIMRGRAAFYEFFSMVYRKPVEEKFLQEMSKFEPLFKTCAEETQNPDLLTGAEGYSQFTSKMNDIEDLLSALNISYTSMFLLGGNSVPASESVFLSPERLVKQDPWEAVRKIFYENKFGIPRSFKEPEDHISIELLFMHFLANNTALFFEEERGDEKVLELLGKQQNFLNNHLLRWTPVFCDMVLAKSGGHIIMIDSVTRLLKGFLVCDKDFLDTLLLNE